MEALRLGLRVSKQKGDTQRALQYAKDGVKISPEVNISTY